MARKSTPAKATAAASRAGTTTATRTTARKAAGTSPAKRAAAKKSTKKTATKAAKKTTGRTAAKKATTAKKAAEKKPAQKRAAKKAPAKVSGFTPAELAEIRGQLVAESEALLAEVGKVEADIADRLRDGVDGAGEDQADQGSKASEREHEISLANNARDLVAQNERAIQRIDSGSYGVCESCGGRIGKERLRVFPRATLCVTCKQREERR